MNFIKRIFYICVLFLGIIFVWKCVCCDKKTAAHVSKKNAVQPTCSFEQIIQDLNRALVFFAQATDAKNADKTIAQKMSIINHREFQSFRAEILAFDAYAGAKTMNVLTLMTLKNWIEQQLVQASKKIKEIAGKFVQEKVATDQELKEIVLVGIMTEKSGQLVDFMEKLFPQAFSAFSKAAALLMPGWLARRAFKKIIPMTLTVDVQGGDYQIVTIDGELDDIQAIQAVTGISKKKTHKYLEQIYKNAKK